MVNPEIIEDLMFDESFGRSKLYFATLQILRMFSDLIRETGRDLRAVNRNSPQLFGDKFYLYLKNKWGGTEDIDGLVTNWKLILEFQNAAENKLMDRIKSKTAEIESLRDGVLY